MKLQQITRGKSKYYHVYLPKNIVEHVIHWHQGDNLEYQVINNNLVLKKLVHPVDKYLEALSCPVCFNHCVVIKIMRNPKRGEYRIVARCTIDLIRIVKIFPENALYEWKWYIRETVHRCDICGGLLEEQLRKESRSLTRPFAKIKFLCRDCQRKRIKVIAKEILDEGDQPPPKDLYSPVIYKKRHLSQKHPPKNCPTCEEEVLPNHVFCSSCGACLLNGEY